MGRFYKTAAPQSIDYMYQLPENLLLQATGQASQDITENQAAMLSLYDKLNLPALQKDKARAKEILAGYEDKINALSQELQQKPLEFRRRTGDILNIARSLQKDFTSGEAASIMGNYASMAEWDKRYDAAIKAGHIKGSDLKDISLLRNKILSDYQGVGYDSSTGNYNQLSPENLIPGINLSERYGKIAKDIESRITATSDSGPTRDGMYIYTHRGKTEEKSRADIMNIIQSEFLQDKEVQDYLRQRTEIGAVSGWYDKDEEGRITGLTPTMIQGEDGKLMWNPNSAFYHLASLTADKNQMYNITDSFASMSANPFAVKQTPSYSDLNKDGGSPTGTVSSVYKVAAVPNDLINPLNPNAPLSIFTNSKPEDLGKGNSMEDLRHRALTAHNSIIDGDLTKVLNTALKTSYIEDPNLISNKVDRAYADARVGKFEPLREVFEDLGIEDQQVINNIENTYYEGQRQADNYNRLTDQYRKAAIDELGGNINNLKTADVNARANQLLNEDAQKTKDMPVLGVRGSYGYTPELQMREREVVADAAAQLKSVANWGLDANILIVVKDGKQYVGTAKQIRSEAKSKGDNDPFSGVLKFSDKKDDDVGFQQYRQLQSVDRELNSAVDALNAKPQTTDDNPEVQREKIDENRIYLVPNNFQNVTDSRGSDMYFQINAADNTQIFVPHNVVNSTKKDQYINAVRPKVEMENRINEANIWYDQLGSRSGVNPEYVIIDNQRDKLKVVYNPKTKYVTIFDGDKVRHSTYGQEQYFIMEKIADSYAK